MIEAFSVTDEEWWWGEPDYPDTDWTKSGILSVLRQMVQGMRGAILVTQGMGKSLHATGLAIDTHRAVAHENHLHVNTTRGYATPEERRNGDQNYLRLTQSKRRVR